MPEPKLTRDMLKERIALDEQYVLGLLQVSNLETIPDSTLKFMRQHPVLKLGLQLIKQPILGTNWSVECKNDKQVEYLETYFLKPFINDVLEKLLLSLDYGRSPLEKVWTTAKFDGRDFYVPKYYVSPDPTKVVLWRSADGYSHFVYGGSKVVPGAKSVLATYEGEHENYYGTTIFKAAYPDWRKEQVQFLEYDRHLEKQGSPPVVVHYPAVMDDDGVTLKYEAKAKAIAEELHGTGYAVIPVDPNIEGGPDANLWRISILETHTDGSHFMERIELAERRMLRGLLVPDSVATRPSTATGTLAETIGRTNTFGYILEGVLNWVEDIINTQIVMGSPVQPEYGLIPLNFNSPDECYVRPDPISDRDKELFDEFVGAILSAKSPDERAAEIAWRYYAQMGGFDADEVEKDVEKKRAERERAKPKVPKTQKEFPTDEEEIKAEHLHLGAEPIELPAPFATDLEAAEAKFVERAGRIIDRDKLKGCNRYETALGTLIKAGCKVGQGYAKEQLDKNKDKMTFSKPDLPKAWINKRAGTTARAQYARLRADLSYIELENPSDKAERLAMTYEGFKAHLKVTAATEAMAGVKRGQNSVVATIARKG